MLSMASMLSVASVSFPFFSTSMSACDCYLCLRHFDRVAVFMSDLVFAFVPICIEASASVSLYASLLKTAPSVTRFIIEAFSEPPGGTTLSALLITSPT